MPGSAERALRRCRQTANAPTLRNRSRRSSWHALAIRPVREHRAVLPLEMRRGDWWRNRRDEIDYAGSTHLFEMLGVPAPPPRLPCRLRQPHAALPIQLLERREDRHARGHAVDKFDHDRRTGTVLALGL